MQPTDLIDLDRLGSSQVLLLVFATLAGLLVVFTLVGLVGWVLGLVQAVIQRSITFGFAVWRELLSWATTAVFLALVLLLLTGGAFCVRPLPGAALSVSLLVLVLGVSACLAYVFIDLERYQVARGYKALHNPLKGQQLAHSLVRYGPRVGIALLAAAGVAVVGGFALLNQGLYATVGRNWYRLGEGQHEPEYVDFLAYSVIHLFSVVDLLHIASSYRFLHASYVEQLRWPASTLLTLYKSFFTLVLLQQVFASVRRGRLLAETISDFWSPHPPIHERARGSLPQYGPGAVHPLLSSLSAAESLTAEQRALLPQVLADIGPAAVPILVPHLGHPDPSVRAVATAALGRLRAGEAAAALVGLLNDPNPLVRQALAEALAGLGHTVGSRRNHLVQAALHSSGLWLSRILRRRRQNSPPPDDPAALALAALRALLADSAAAVRARAAESLGEVGNAAAPAAPDLVQLLRDDDEVVRCRAAEALGRVADRSAETVDPLTSLLAEPNAPVRIAVAGALGELGAAAAPAVPSLLPLLQHSDEAVRQAAAEAVGRIGVLPENASRGLCDGLSSADNVVREQVAEALGTIGAPAAEAAPELASALADDSDRVRAKAAEALGKMGEAAAGAVPKLVRALRDQDNWVSALAAEALGEIGDSAAEAAVPALVRSLRHPNPLIRANAAEALGKMGTAARGAIPPLVNALRDPEDLVRIESLRALGELAETGKSTVQPVLAAASDANPEVRAAAVEAVGRLGGLGADGAPVLVGAVGDDNEEVRLQAGKALARITRPTKSVLDGLCQLLEDSNLSVQVQAAETLAQLGEAACATGPGLLRAAQSGEADLRVAALRAIAQILPPEGADAFQKGLRDARPEVRKVAAAGLVRLAEAPAEAGPELLEALHDPEPTVRCDVARVLARFDPLPADALPGLRECAADPDDSVRLNAARALRRAQPGDATETFGALLHDGNSRIRLLAAGYLLGADPTNAEAAGVVTASLTEKTPGVRRAAMQLIDSLEGKEETAAKEGV